MLAWQPCPGEESHVPWARSGTRAWDIIWGLCWKRLLLSGYRIWPLFGSKGNLVQGYNTIRGEHFRMFTMLELVILKYFHASKFFSGMLGDSLPEWLLQAK